MPSAKEMKNVLIGIGVAGAAVVVLGTKGISYGINYMSGENPARNMPRDVNIEQGFAKPSELELKLGDINQNGANEFYAIHNGKRYGIFNDNGTLKLRQVSYEIKPIYWN